MTYLMTMFKVNIHEAKAHLSEYLERIQEGEVLVICKRNVPIAEVRAVPRQPDEPRPVGLARGAFKVPDSFFEPLPEALEEAFNGGLL